MRLLDDILDSINAKMPAAVGGGKWLFGRVEYLRNLWLAKGGGGNAVFDYDFLMSLDEKDYQKYLSLAYLVKTGEKLNLKNPVTINEKIQWLKIYDNLPIKTQLTDKVLVRDWIKDKIGEEYLKPVLWVGNNFDAIPFEPTVGDDSSLIPFEPLPNSFIVKANHGCKWHFIVKDKQTYLDNSRLFQLSKNAMNNWMEQSFFGWSDFEGQYRYIKPQIIIEELLRENETQTNEFEIWCFNGIPKIIQDIKKENQRTRSVCSYDENLNYLNLNFIAHAVIENHECSEYLLKAIELSKILSKGFKLVRIDWILYQNKLYFSEMTFTPYSGQIPTDDSWEQWQLRMGDMLNLKGNENG